MQFGKKQQQQLNRDMHKLKGWVLEKRFNEVQPPNRSSEEVEAQWPTVSVVDC